MNAALIFEIIFFFFFPSDVQEPRLTENECRTDAQKEQAGKQGLGFSCFCLRSWRRVNKRNKSAIPCDSLSEFYSTPYNQQESGRCLEQANDVNRNWRRSGAQRKRPRMKREGLQQQQRCIPASLFPSNEKKKSIKPKWPLMGPWIFFPPE